MYMACALANRRTCTCGNTNIYILTYTKIYSKKFKETLPELHRILQVLCLPWGEVSLDSYSVQTCQNVENTNQFTLCQEGWFYTIFCFNFKTVFLYDPRWLQIPHPSASVS